jgi:hypothetical protein
MRLRVRIIVTGIKLSLLVAAVSACASSGNPLTQTTEYDTLTPGWESKFSIESNVQPEPDGTSLLYGQITSHYGEYASPFRVLGMAVDSSGKVIGQRIEWVPGGIPGFAHAYFEISHLPAAPSYKVTVWDYTFIEARRAQAP